MLPPDAVFALDTIYQTSRDVQLRGWHWNKEIQSFSPDNDGFIVLPVTIAKVDTIGRDFDIDVVQRGQKLYDRKNNTYVFTRPLKLETVTILDFDDLPLSCKTYISIRSAMLFQESILGAPELDQMLARRAQEAWVELQRDEINTADSNVLRDNNSTASILYRAQYIGRRG